MAVVCHDAGGAEILSSYIRQQGISPAYCIAGPALKIFNRKLGALENRTLERVLDEVDWFLCGTSWQSDLEWKLFDLARTKGKKTIAFLDHWVNYRERFIRDGVECFPDEIWVGDEDSERLAKNVFSDLPIKLVDNPYFEDLKLEFNKIDNKDATKNMCILYVCEPIAEHMLLVYGNERHLGYTEEDALRYFLDNLSPLNISIEKIIIRPHPSESPDKYKWALDYCDVNIELGGMKDLTEEVALSDVVVGCESMAMVVGLLAKRRVISCIPPGGKDCALPQINIEVLSKIKAATHVNEIKGQG